MGYGDDHLENVELQRLLSALKLGADFDPYEVIHTPADDPGHTTVMTSFRLHKDLLQAVKDVSGRGARFRDASTFLRHAVALTLKVEQALFPDSEIQATLLPVNTWISQQNNRIQKEAVDNLIKCAEVEIRAADGELDRQRVLNDLHNVFTWCQQKGYTQRMSDIRAILERNENR